MLMDPYVDLDVASLTLDDPETGEIVIDEETGEVLYKEAVVQENRRLTTCSSSEIDSETGEPLDVPMQRSTFRVPMEYVNSDWTITTVKNWREGADKKSSGLCQIVVAEQSYCFLLGARRKLSKSGVEETDSACKKPKDIRGKFGNNFLEGQAWPKLLISIGLFFLMPGFVVPLFLMVKLYIHYGYHRRSNPDIFIDEDEVFPCGLRRKDIGRYMIIHTLIQMCRICREEFAGEKFARAHSDLGSSIAASKKNRSGSVNLSCAERICGCA
ncbi:uncharacterized protein LOC136038739 [Artemia franciscana]|uniref:uncharacterized protein LOC136038739 n=1 Tax=Artemia franciscana TaxID=6661 RepID=UPI0032DA963B